MYLHQVWVLLQQRPQPEADGRCVDRTRVRVPALKIFAEMYEKYLTLRLLRHQEWQDRLEWGSIISAAQQFSRMKIRIQYSDTCYNKHMHHLHHIYWQCDLTWDSTKLQTWADTSPSSPPPGDKQIRVVRQLNIALFETSSGQIRLIRH